MHRLCLFVLCVFLCDAASAAVCPTGTTSIIRGDGLVSRVLCDDGTRVGAADTVSFPGLGCADGLRRLNKSGDGAGVSVYANKYSERALNVKMGDKVCYINFVQEQRDNTLVVMSQDGLYYATDLELCLGLGASETATLDQAPANRVEWKSLLGGTTVRGVSHCASSAGETNTNYTDLTVSSDADSNIYCYCRTIMPVVSEWVFSMEFASVVNCNKYCAARCSENFADDAEFRDAMLRNIYMVN